MKGPTTNPYSGQNINNQTAGAYTGALGVANDQLGMGQAALGTGASAMGEAGNLYRQAGTMMPSDVTAGQLSNTNLDPYMNPFQQNVIDTTMNEMNRQEQIYRNNIGDQFLKAGAFGGDREAVEYSNARRDFRDQEAGILSKLNQANFQNAQNMAIGDIDRRFQGDTNNQAMRQNMYGMGAQGLGGLGKDALNAGINWYDPSKLSGLAQQGFDFADTIAKNNLQAGTLQQQQMQSLIDAAKLQWEQFTNKPLQGLAAITGSYQPLNPKSETNPSALGVLGNITKAVGGFKG